jgi:1-phosphatidylinositol-4-phosphate 5-kinase
MDEITSQLVLYGNQLKRLSIEFFDSYRTIPSFKNAQFGKNKALYRGGIYWFYFRYYLPLFFSALFLIFLILSFTIYNTIEGNLVLGSSLSLFMTLSVLASYVMIIPWRKHPSSLIFYKSLMSVLFSLGIILEAISTNRYSCRSYAVFTQFTMVAGECWLTTIGLDLKYSLTNPFISYKTNLKKYHMLVWGFSSLLSFIFYFDTSCQGKFDQGICWLNISSTNSPCLWGFFLFWILIMYTYQAYALLYARSRLQKGLPTTFEVRKKCALDTFRCLTIYGVYLLILVFMFLIITSDPSPQPDSGIAKFSMFFLFIISNRGSVDGIAWFVLHDFGSQKSESKSGKYAYEKIESSIPENALSVSTDKKSTVHHRKSKIDVVELKHNVEEIKHKVTNTITELADLAIAELDEADLSPQVNTALRQQIVHYVTKGVRNAVLNIDTDKKPFTEFKDVMDSLFQFKGIDLADVKGLTKLEFLLDGEYPFKAYAPEIFTQLRGIEGINDDRYLSVLSASANERLSEGASGAFMFYCGGGEFIVKTIRAREAQVLHSSLLTYSKYLKKYRDSLLCRILGSYSLELYNQVFYFVVMLNCFDPHAYINDRYDIKGSWVGRSAEPKKKGKKVVCRHCNEYFIPSKAEQCKAIVGTHEASVVLKDNDLRTKISLHPEEAKRVLKILKRDSELLGKLGVMDYRLGGLSLSLLRM